MEELFNRRSVRTWKDKAVEPEKIEGMLRAAMQAPSAHNGRPWAFVVVRDPQTLTALSQVTPYARMLSRAPLAVAVLAEPGRSHAPEFYQQDLAASVENLLLAAVSYGLGAVWIGIAPHEEAMARVQSLLGVPEGSRAFCLVGIGYPQGQENRFLDRFEPTRVHAERYGTPWEEEVQE